MLAFIENILKGVKTWVEGIVEDVTYVTCSHINDLYDTKQDTISDLASIRSGAALGATALQSFTESDPTVPSWAKAQNKPSYTASEITNAVGSTSVTTIWKGTQSEYDAIQNKSDSTFYIIVPNN